MHIQEIESPYVKNHPDMDYLKTLKTPIIERTGDGIFIHFLYVGDSKTKTVHVLGSFPGWDLEKGEMSKLLDMPIWVKSYQTDEAFASTYHFSINDEFGDNWEERFKHFHTDPLNAKKLRYSEKPGDQKIHTSYVTAYTALHSANISNHNNHVYQKTFTSTILGNQRNLWIYDPITASETPKNLLIVFDGAQYTDTIPVPEIIDSLYAEGKIPPTIMVGIDSPDRFNEFNGNEEFAEFVTNELLPWIRQTFSVSHNPKNIALCGSSLGGLTAFYLGFKHPNLFGNILSQSGSLNRKKADNSDEAYWSVQYIYEQDLLPLQIYMNAGCLEVEALQEANALTYEALCQKGYSVNYQLFNGGHDVLWWRETFHFGLDYLFSEN